MDGMTRTTPPRPADITAVFPQLALLASTATRLHPRPGSPSVRDSSVGGPLLWPAAEPWPHCDGPHELDGWHPAMSLADVRLGRRIRAAASGRSMTPQERETLRQISPLPDYPITKRPVPQPYDGPIAMLPVAQLCVRDVPDLPAPAGSDLLQVLWCPFDHPPEDYMPRTAVFWRSAAAVTDVLNTPPEPPAVQYDHYVLEPCLIDPEQVTEYPAPLELDEELREQLEEWGARHKEPGGDYDGGEQAYYQYELSVAPGWKVGGWAPWSFRDPSPQHCPACGTPMLPLLTIATGEWDASNHSWIPYENQAALSSTSHGYPRYPRPSNPTAVQIGRGYNQQLYICPVAPEHPHTEWMQ
jgi:hypothetical protein